MFLLAINISFLRKYFLFISSPHLCMELEFTILFFKRLNMSTFPPTVNKGQIFPKFLFFVTFMSCLSELIFHCCFYRFSLRISDIEHSFIFFDKLMFSMNIFLWISLFQFSMRLLSVCVFLRFLLVLYISYILNHYLMPDGKWPFSVFWMSFYLYVIIRTAEILSLSWYHLFQLGWPMISNHWR